MKFRFKDMSKREDRAGGTACINSHLTFNWFLLSDLSLDTQIRTTHYMRQIQAAFMSAWEISYLFPGWAAGVNKNSLLLKPPWEVGVRWGVNAAGRSQETSPWASGLGWPHLYPHAQNEAASSSLLFLKCSVPLICSNCVYFYYTQCWNKGERYSCYKLKSQTWKTREKE